MFEYDDLPAVLWAGMKLHTKFGNHLTKVHSILFSNGYWNYLRDAVHRALGLEIIADPPPDLFQRDGYILGDSAVVRLGVDTQLYIICIAVHIEHLAQNEREDEKNNVPALALGDTTGDKWHKTWLEQQKQNAVN